MSLTLGFVVNNGNFVNNGKFRQQWGMSLSMDDGDVSDGRDCLWKERMSLKVDNVSDIGGSLMMEAFSVL